jgi:hypothetical protein
LHAIPAAAENRTFAWVRAHLRQGGVFVAEARSVKGDMFGVGKCIGPDEYVNGHYRRFLRMEVIRAKLERLGFTIDLMIEEKGVAVYKDDDPVVLRFIARVN